MTTPQSGHESPISADPRAAVLITVGELARLLGADPASATPGVETTEPRTAGIGPVGNHGPVLLDVRWTLTRPDGREAFAAGHIPGARYVSLDEELSDHSPQDPRHGRHPLPTAEAFETTARSWGVRSGSPGVPGAAGDPGESTDPGVLVVVYDDAGSQAAARAWWLLRWAGHENVRVLDGGWSAWRDAGLPAETGAGARADRGGDFTIRPGSMPVLSADEAADLAQSESGVLLDARAPERYEGLTEPMDPVAGHIPGALNAPAGADADGRRLRGAEELDAHYGDLGALRDGVRVGAYCGSGVSASHTVLTLASLGVEAALFPGSWSAWSNDPGRPVATGTES